MALASARGGHGTALLLEGEAGIGKTALIGAATAAATEAGSRLMSAYGAPLDEGVA